MPRFQILNGKGLDASVRQIQKQVVLWYPSRSERNKDIPLPWDGAVTLFPEASTLVLEAWDGTAWKGISGSGGTPGVTDHGALTGLADDDHPQYLLPIDVVAGANITVTRPGDGTVSVAGPAPGMDQTTADARYVNVAGDTMSGVLNMGGSQIKSVGAPSQTLDSANKGYVDNLVDAIPWKKPVRLATTANLAALSGLAAIDGVTPAGNDRILVKNQTTTTQNGIYLAASGSWTRATDADGLGELNSAAVLVQEGTTQADTMWIVTTNGNILPGSTAHVWNQFGAGSGVTAHSALTGLTTGDDHPQYLKPAEVTAGTNILVNYNGDGSIIVGSPTSHRKHRYACQIAGATPVTSWTQMPLGGLFETSGTMTIQANPGGVLIPEAGWYLVTIHLTADRAIDNVHVVLKYAGRIVGHTAYSGNSATATWRYMLSSVFYAESAAQWVTFECQTTTPCWMGGDTSESRFHITSMF